MSSARVDLKPWTATRGGLSHCRKMVSCSQITALLPPPPKKIANQKCLVFIYLLKRKNNAEESGREDRPRASGGTMVAPCAVATPPSEDADVPGGMRSLRVLCTAVLL